MLLPEDEEDGAAEAKSGPDEVEAEFFAHEEQGERHEDGERDDLLHDLQLGERERGVADLVIFFPVPVARVKKQLPDTPISYVVLVFLLA